MTQEKPRRGYAAGRGSSSQIRPTDSTRSLAHKQPRPAPAPDLVGLRERLLEARRRLVERIAEDFPADRRFPDTGWSRLLADIQLVIAAVDDVVAEVGHDGRTA